MDYDGSLRTATVKKILAKYWPNHHVIWINNTACYKEINYLISLKTKPDVIICQTEEDWFYTFSVEYMRNRLASDKNWTANSFLITNSKQDYEISKKFLNVKFRPGILDLISYHPYDKNIVNLNLNDINFHTAYFYGAVRTGRSFVTNVLLNNIDKVAILKTNDKMVVNLESVADTESDVFFIEKRDAPNVNINQDYFYTKHCAFTIAFESFNGLHRIERSNINCGHFSPTLSEKTYKSIHMLRPCLVFGGYNTRQYLKDLGFDTWDWLIDWTFDTETHPYKRLYGYCKELERLLAIDIGILKELINSNQDKLFFNRDRLFFLIENYDKDLF
jgi:hypothetical protein